MEPEPFFFDHLGPGADDDPVDLGLCRAVRHTAFAEKALADDLAHLRGELLFPSRICLTR